MEEKVEFNEKPKYRHELKHRINFVDKSALRASLLKVAKRDPNYDGPYHIRSLYFDNLYDRALVEKLDGLEVREKFRIRYYNMDESFIRLEKKSKLNQLCLKKSAKVTKEQCLNLINGNWQWLRETGDPLHDELFAKMSYQVLRPVVLVDYIREAFVYESGNVRITLDYDIRSAMKSIQMFEKNLPTIPADFSFPIILEVKYDEFMPEIINKIIQLGNRHCSQFSKYAASRLIYA